METDVIKGDPTPSDPSVDNPTDPAATDPVPDPAIDPEPDPQPAALNSDDIADKAFQKMTTWLGRRDKDLLENVGTAIDSKIAAMRPKEEPSNDAVFDDPNKWLDTQLDAKAQKAAEYNQEVITACGRSMEADALFEDTELGNEVVKKVQASFGGMKRNLPPKDAAELLLSGAIKGVLRDRKQVKKNALDKNKPTKEALGGVDPPAGETGDVKAPKGLDEYTLGMAKKWGYDAKDLHKVFGDGSDS